MKPVAIFIVVAAFAVASLAVQAKTVTSQQGNSNETSVAAVAGPDAAAKTADRRVDGKLVDNDGEKSLKKNQSAPAKPEHHDPN